MRDVQAQMSELVARFMADVTAVAREAARAELMVKLRGASPAAPAAGSPVVAARKPRDGAASTPPTPTSISTATAAAARVVRPKGEKRPVHELHQIRARLRAFIAERPGLRSEEIYAALGLTQRDIMLPLRKLVADGEVRAEGTKRSTRYFPADGARRPSARAAPLPPPAPVVRRR